MKPPTYGEALAYVLRTPRDLCAVLDYFAPVDKANALGALAELYKDGAVIRQNGLYVFVRSEAAS